MSNLASFADVASLRRVRDFAEILSIVVGDGPYLSDDDALASALRAVDARGLLVPRDFASALTGPFDRLVADVPFVTVAADHFGGGRPGPLTVSFPTRGGPRFGPILAREPSTDEYRRRFSARCHRFPDDRRGRVAVHAVVEGEDLLVATARDVGGRVSVGRRRIPVDDVALPGKIDLSVLDPDDLWRLYLSGHVPESAPRPSPVRDPDREGRLDVRPPDRDAFDVDREIAFREFFLSIEDDAGRALRLATRCWDAPDFPRAQRVLAAMAARPERFLQAFRASPFLADCVVLAAGGSAGQSSAGTDALVEWARRAGRDVPSRIAGGESPRKTCAAVLDGLLGRRACPAAVSSMLGYGYGIDGVGRLRVGALDRALSGVARHRPLLPEECEATWGAIAKFAEALTGYGRGYEVPVDADEERLPDPATCRAVAMAVRDGAGTFRPMSRDVADAMWWTVARARMAGFDGAAQEALLRDSFFPKGRRHAGVTALSDLWHVRAAALVAVQEARAFAARIAASGVDPAGLFPAFPRTAPSFPVVGVHPGIEVRQLRSLEALVVEGTEMNHCVAGYGLDASSGLATTFSIRDGRHRATASVVFSPSGRFSVGQVRGPSNSDPRPAHVEIVYAMVRGITEADRRNFLAAHLAAEAVRREVMAFAGGSAALRENEMDFAFETLRPFLPRAMRAMDRLSCVAALTPSGTSGSRRDGPGQAPGASP